MVLVVILLGLIGASQAEESRPEVSLDQGVVRGITVRSRATMKYYYAFQKIPYAAPPLGELRYKDPQPPEPWSGVLDGGEDMPKCIQPPVPKSLLKMQRGGDSTEDCLYLSVYTNERYWLPETMTKFVIRSKTKGESLSAGNDSRYGTFPDVDTHRSSSTLNGACHSRSLSGEKSATAKRPNRLFNPDWSKDFPWILYAQVPTGSSPLKPVMVWIHGGGFISGSGTPNMFGPDFLVEKDVLVVLVNYRLGMLGFLSLNNTHVPGNMGLKDQVAALRWVQKNIAKFGGDPKQVTIFGESAGSASTHLLMLSPMTKGLFQRVICESGTGLNPWAFKPSVLENTKVLLNFVGCENLEGDELLKCLKEVPAEKLAGVNSKCASNEDKWVEISKPVYATIDDTFLPREPRQILKDGDYNKVPLLIGINDADGLIVFNANLKHQTKLEFFNDNMEKMIPRDLYLKPGSEDSKEVAKMIKDFYFDGKLTPDKADLYKDLSTDRLFLIGTHQAVQLHAATSDQPIYLYEFAFEGAFGIMKPIWGSPEYRGVCHADELFYIHAVNIVDYEQFTHSPEMLTLQRMVTMWTNFAKYGNPTPEQSTLLPVTWRPYTLKDPAYLFIKNQLTVERNIEEKRMKFWDGVYERYANFSC